MIAFRFCKKCKLGKVELPEFNREGEMTLRPSVRCDLTGDMYLMNDEPPDDCPYLLEHKLVMQNCPDEFADHMSGKLPEHTDEPFI